MMLSEKVFKEGMQEIENAFDGFNITEEKIRAWYKYSKYLTDSQWEEKIKKCIRFCRKIPTLADILDLAGYYRGEEDWSKVKTFEKENYEYKPIPAEVKEIMNKLIDKLTPGYRARKERRKEK